MSSVNACGCGGWEATRQAAADAAAARANWTRHGDDEGHRTGHGHHGHRAHGRGHGLVQAIRQVLEQLGVGVTDPATTDAAVTDAPVVTDAVAAPDTTVVTDAATDVPATDPATTDAADAPAADAPATDSTSTGPASPREVRHAMHAFIHALFQSLTQNVKPLAGGTDAGGNRDRAGASTDLPAVQFPYRNPATDLAGLAQGAGTDGSGGGLDLTTLNARFQDLVTALGGDPASPTVTLRSFLEALLAQLGGTSGTADAPSPVGGLVTTTA